MLNRVSCWILTLTWAALVAGCASMAPNSGFAEPPWLAVNGPVANDTRLLPLTAADGSTWRAVRPSVSEQGLTHSNWEAVYLVLVPVNRSAASTGKGPFSEAVAAALATCAPDLGSYADEAGWAANLARYETGKVLINGTVYYQYVVHRATWSVVVSDTGRGHRLSQLGLQSFGTFRPVSSTGSAKATVRAAYLTPEYASDRVSIVALDQLNTAAVNASCSGGLLRITGPTASASAGPWFNGILRQPFNVQIELQEEVLP